MTIVELPSTDLVEASRTAEWFVPVDWTPPAMMTAELPVLRMQPRHPNIAIFMLLAAVAASIVIVTFAFTIAVAAHDETPKETVVVAPPVRTNVPAKAAVLPVPSNPGIPSIDVNDLPRSKRKR